MQKFNQILDNLVANGQIKEYILTRNIPMAPDDTSGSRMTDALEIIFPSGEKLKLDTFCSGCAENTTLIINDK